MPSQSESTKENQSPKDLRSLPYRTVFAVLTQDSILVYDTHHTRPLAIVRGLHYSNLVDCQWSKDGHHLVVCSSDGYISIVSFSRGELGDIYSPPTLQQQVTAREVVGASEGAKTGVLNHGQEINILTARPKSLAKDQDPAIIPPCEPGQSALEEPPSKKKRISPTLISTADTTPNEKIKDHTSNQKRSVTSVLEAGDGVKDLSLDNEEKPKKKKRVQPMLISTGNF